MSLETDTHNVKRLFKKYTSCFAALLRKRENIGDMNVKPGILVYGGNGVLGSKCIYQLKVHEDGWVVSIDYRINTHADVNILISKDDTIEIQQRDILTAIEASMGSYKFDVILCLSDGEVNGSADSDLLQSMDHMYRMNIQNSLICSRIAVNYLRRGGLFVLSGSKNGIHPTPEMVTYGMSKAAVHHLVKSLAKKNSGMPPESMVIGILSPILDEAVLAKVSKSKGLVDDGSTSNDNIANSLQHITDMIVRWTHLKEVPPSGSLCHLHPNGNRVDTVLY